MKSDVAAAYKALGCRLQLRKCKGHCSHLRVGCRAVAPTHTIAKGNEIEKFFYGLLKNGVKSHALKVVEAGGSEQDRLRDCELVGDG